MKVLFSGAIVWYDRNQFFRPGIAFTYAHPGGMPVSIHGEMVPKNINGIVIRFFNSQLFLHFRRMNRLGEKK